MANLKFPGTGKQFLSQVLSQNGVKLKPYMKQHQTEKPTGPSPTNLVKNIKR